MVAPALQFRGVAGRASAQAGEGSAPTTFAKPRCLKVISSPPVAQPTSRIRADGRGQVRCYLLDDNLVAPQIVLRFGSS